MPLTTQTVPPRGRLVRGAFAAGALVVDLWVWGGDTRTATGGSASVALIVAIACLGYASLAIWRSPIPGYLALWTLSLAGLAVPSIVSFAGFLVGLFLMARLMHLRPALFALAGSVVPIIVNTTAAMRLHPESDSLFLFTNAGLWMLTMLTTWVIGRVLAQNDQRLKTERRWAGEALSEAISVERLRISRDIHDIVAHSLTGIILQSAGARVGLARKTVTNTDIDLALESIQHAGEQSMRELHRLLGMLRETDQSAATSYGLEALGQLTDEARLSGVDVVVRTNGQPVELDPSIARTVYRVVQEGLSNAMKHGGTGTRIEVTSDWLSDSVTVTVHNTFGVGVTATTPSGGFGIVGLRERVSVSGGRLEAGLTADGYLLQATLPTTDHTFLEDR